jgi:hypothetical protein
MIMENRMQDAVDVLMETFQGFCGIVITYSRGSTELAGIEATVGRTPYEVVIDDVMISHESRDYFINKSDLISGGTQWKPQSGDRITEVDGRIYEVSMPKHMNVYESMGPEGRVFKIHTIGPKS